MRRGLPYRQGQGYLRGARAVPCVAEEQVPGELERGGALPRDQGVRGLQPRPVVLQELVHAGGPAGEGFSVSGQGEPHGQVPDPPEGV
jgi:hypothetical protein